jgi:hypothetical protein
MSANGSRPVQARFGASAFPDGPAGRGGILILVGLVTASCTSMLGIDGDYVQGIKTGSGGAGGNVSASGGSAGDGGAGETGGSGDGGSASGGTGSGGLASGGANAGCGTSGACGSGEKCCAPPGNVIDGAAPPSVCVKPAPLFGCGPTDCGPCPVPMNGIAVCTRDQCDFVCNSTYDRVGNLCQPGGAGGVGGGSGGSGAGGAPPPPCTKTDSSKCAQCFPIGLFTCCRNNATCGCTWAPGPLCY